MQISAEKATSAENIFTKREQDPEQEISCFSLHLLTINLKLLLMFNKEIKMDLSEKVFKDLQDSHDVTLWILVAWSALLVTVQSKQAEFVLTWPVIYS